VNPEVDARWATPEMTHTTQVQMSLRAKLGRWGLAMARACLSQKKRNTQLQLDGLLQCLACNSNELKFSDLAVICVGCGKQYDVVSGVPRMSVES